MIYNDKREEDELFITKHWMIPIILLNFIKMLQQIFSILWVITSVSCQPCLFIEDPLDFLRFFALVVFKIF